MNNMNEFSKHELQKSYDKQQQQCLKLENVLASTKNAVVEKQRQAFTHLDQIQQLYALLSRRNGNDPKFKRDQVEEQLDFIKDEIETIQEIIELANEMMAIETKSDIAEYGSGRSGKARKWFKIFEPHKNEICSKTKLIHIYQYVSNIFY